MSTSLEIVFPWGRYHATPWGRHVNEAAIEWPPSPWRLLRALYATWKTRAPELDANIVEPMLAALSDVPQYALPESTEAHTRHYMPDLAEGTDKVIDACAVMARDARLVVTWPVDLADQARAALGQLAELLPYLGRAESICDARLLAQGDPIAGARCEAIAPGGGTELAQPPIDVLVPEVPIDFGALTAGTTAVRGQGFLRPPGTRWQPYRRPIPAALARSTVPRRAAAPTVVRWSIATAAKPSCYAAVAMADVLRRACMAKFGKTFDGAASPVLAGKDAVGVPLEGHGHAHYLAMDVDGDRLLDTLVLWAPAGLGEREARALGALDRLTGSAHVRDFRPCRLGLEGFGADVISVAPELSGPSRIWESVTPFAPPRHGRRRRPWVEHVYAELVRELGYRGLPAPAAIEFVGHDALAYRRYRVSERLEQARRAALLRLTFDAPVAGPMCLGALSHFGLGLMRPVNDGDPTPGRISP
ncbi:MAG: type I-U CRISPR-associated protein Csb2 [Acidimicrobiia bacterium]